MWVVPLLVHHTHSVSHELWQHPELSPHSAEGIIGMVEEMNCMENLTSQTLGDCTKTACFTATVNHLFA